MRPLGQANQDTFVAEIRDAGVHDARVLEAFRQVPRAAFVPPKRVGEAYVDRPLPIPHDQVTTQPSLVAKMVEALALTGSEHVLEIGTGYGFQTALLAYLSRFVWSVERWPDLAETARASLTRAGVVNVEVVVGDGTEGLPEHAPFNAIVVAATFPQVPAPLVEQLTLGAGWAARSANRHGRERAGTPLREDRRWLGPPRHRHVRPLRPAVRPPCLH